MFLWPDNIRVLLFPFYCHSKVRGLWVVWGGVSTRSMGLLCQRSRRGSRNPPAGAFKWFPLHLNRVWQRWCSENATELRPLGKWVEEHIWGRSQRRALAPEAKSLAGSLCSQWREALSLLGAKWKHNFELVFPQSGVKPAVAGVGCSVSWFLDLSLT